jgi:hypothetical protein
VVVNTPNVDERAMSPWELGVLGICRSVFPNGTSYASDGVYVHEDPRTPEHTVKWFQRNAQYHFSSEHPFNVGDPANLHLAIRAAAGGFLRLTNLFNVVYAFETTGGGIREGTVRATSGIGLVLDLARDPTYRSQDSPLRSPSPHVMSYEPPATLQARYLINAFGFERAMEYLVTRQHEFIEQSGIPLERSAFLDEIEFSDHERHHLRSLPATRALYAGARFGGKGFTLIHEPEHAGPFRVEATRLWQFRNACAGGLLRALGKKVPTFSLGGHGHAKDLSAQIALEDTPLIFANEPVQKWTAEQLAKVPDSHFLGKNSQPGSDHTVSLVRDLE